MQRKRFSIFGRQSGADHETEILQVDNDPEVMVRALQTKVIPGPHRLRLYDSLRIEENHS